MFRVLVASTTEVLGEERIECSDCSHEHGGAPHGFCTCGCTYPGTGRKDRCYLGKGKMTMKHVYKVEVGKGSKGAYKTRYTFELTHSQMGRAILHYNSINIGNGYKKRLTCDGVVLDRQFS